MNLNGTWTFCFDPGNSGLERGLAKSSGFSQEIVVPFCPESELSGVQHTDFISHLWYQRSITVPGGWEGKRVWLHFGAVDYACEVFIDGTRVGRHWGGTSSFAFDITAQAAQGSEHSIVVSVHDDVRSKRQPGGKQSQRFCSHDCYYTRTTGIWQTVWLEAVDAYGLEQVQIVPDLDAGRLVVTPRFYAIRQGNTLRITTLADGKVVSQVEQPALNGLPFEIRLDKPRAWSPDDPFLYDLNFELLDGETVLDRVRSYAGLRKVHIEGNRFFLNNQPYYLRLVLDQGFYPGGIWTAPSDADLRRDIELAQCAGFNGARLHQKVFEERFHYWADRMGYLTWGESSSWGMDLKEPLSARNFLSEWREIVTRDRNHPSIIAWTPFNETHDVGDSYQHNRAHVDAYDLTRDLDPTRPVNDASGYVHVKTDLWTAHNYEQDPEKLAGKLALPNGEVFRNFPEHEVAYSGQPYLLDEFGGIKWIPAERRPFAENSWGYGLGPRSLEEFYQRLEGQVGALLDQGYITGFCYTQLTDVEQEQNGIYNYDRSAKFDTDRIARIFRKPRE
jgi:beta-galactosidase/beta-glucuronidase